MDPARSAFLEVSFEGVKGNVELLVEQWRDSTIDVVFRDRLHRNSGVIQFDGGTGGAIVRTSRPYGGKLAEDANFREYFASMMKVFANPFTFGWSPENVISYDEDYHSSNNYIQGDDREVAIKMVQAKIIAELASPQKCVIAGCSNGELVRQCHAMGIDAYGFDVIPNLKEIAFDEARDYVRYGSLTNIPYDCDDRFDTLVAIDVLEHIPERDIHRMVEEWVRLGIRKLVLLINLNQFWYPGHITMRPLWWWAERWKAHYRNAAISARFPHLPSVYSNTGEYNQQWTVWEAIHTQD